MVLHFVGPGELLAADGAWEDLALVSLVIQESMSLEAVLVLKGLLDVDLGAFCALVDTLRDRGISEQIQTPDGHLGELFGRVLRLRGGPATHPAFGHLATGWRAHVPGGLRRVSVARHRRGARRSCRRRRRRRAAARRRGRVAVGAAVVVCRGRRARGSRRRFRRWLVRCGRLFRSAHATGLF